MAVKPQLRYRLTSCKIKRSTVLTCHKHVTDMHRLRRIGVLSRRLQYHVISYSRAFKHWLAGPVKNKQTLPPSLQSEDHHHDYGPLRVVWSGFEQALVLWNGSYPLPCVSSVGNM